MGGAQCERRALRCQAINSEGNHCPWPLRGRSSGTDLADAGVGALDVLAGQVEPAGGVGIDGRAVVPQGAPALAAAPAALELPLRLQAHAAAVPLRHALVQVHCRAERRRRGHLQARLHNSTMGLFNLYIVKSMMCSTRTW